MKKELEILQMIIEDMENDIKQFDGKPFNGRTLGELHGNLCATIQALAGIMKKYIETTEENK